MIELIEISLLLLVFLTVLLGGGVWIALALMATGYVGMQFVGGNIPAGPVLADHDLGQQRVVDARGLAAFHLDGRDPVSHAAVGRDVPRARALAQLDSRPADARQRAGLRHLRLGVGLLGRDLRDRRQDRAARTEEARLRREGEPRLARRRRHARHSDSAVDHHGGLCGAGQRLDHPGLSRGLPAGPARDGALFRLHRALVARQSGEDAAARARDAVRAEASRIRQADPDAAADRARVPLAPDGLGDRDRMRRLGRARLARDRVVARRARLGFVLGERDGRDAGQLHDHADPRRRVLHVDLDGLYRHPGRARRPGSTASTSRLTR